MYASVRDRSMIRKKIRYIRYNAPRNEVFTNTPGRDCSVSNGATRRGHSSIGVKFVTARRVVSFSSLPLLSIRCKYSVRSTPTSYTIVAGPMLIDARVFSRIRDRASV